MGTAMPTTEGQTKNRFKISTFTDEEKGDRDDISSDNDDNNYRNYNCNEPL